MPLLASNVLPQDALPLMKRRALNVRDYLTVKKTQLQSDTNADVILGIFFDLQTWRDELTSLKAIPGIAQYARDQENDQAYDVVTEFNTFVSALTDVMANIYTSFPKDASGYLQEKKLLVDGTYEFRQFTAAQTATLRGLFDVVIAQVV
jgi:hypothetical protein